jgi:NADH-quinone oxidoreductase subunit C
MSDEAETGSSQGGADQPAAAPEGSAPGAPASPGAADQSLAGAAEQSLAGPSQAADGPDQTAGGPEPAAAAEAPSRPTTLHGCPVDQRAPALVVHCNRSDYLPLMTGLKGDGYELPVGVTGVDYLTHPGRDLPAEITPERFEVVVELLSLQHHQRVRVRCQVPAGDPSVPTLFDLWPGTEAHERETYDMFGIRFDGHPDPSRILMPEDWEGHPLRKDYDTGHIPIQFKEAPK